MMEFALVTSREKPVPIAPPCSSPRNPAHFHCVTHHVGFEFLRTVQRHVDARCVVIYCCPQHGPELPYAPRLIAAEPRRATRAAVQGTSASCG